MNTKQPKQPGRLNRQQKVMLPCAIKNGVEIVELS